MGKGAAGEKTRGELGEIKASLAALSAGGMGKADAVAAKRDVFKRIINFMTIGVDMSSLFMQVMTCAVSHNDDLVLKKMLYLYICTYAQANPDLTLLTINLLTKDCKDQDPTIRGLALRSLCQLKVANLVEYLMSPIQQGLKDVHPYVRRTAVMGVLKVYNMDKGAVQRAGLLEDLRKLLRSDPDAQVVANCMSVLQQTGGLESLINKSLVIPLLNRIKEFSEWAQCQVLEVVSGWHPDSEQAVYDILNVLDDRLSHSNSAVVMATVKVFLHLTLHLPATHQQVLERVKDPLQTMISRDHFETAYAVLAHFLLLAQRAPILFSSIYMTFFCRHNEPSYIKQIKLEILSCIADENNAYDIVTELTEYVSDIDEQLARDAVRAVGRIALEVVDAEGIVERLLGFLDMGRPCVTAEALIHISDLLRKQPSLADACISAVSTISPQDVEEPEARAAFIWILGEHGQAIQDAPYLLEPLAGALEEEEVAVRLALLTAAAKLFFKRPPECQRLLGLTLSKAAADPDQDVHDRALLYTRLLQHSVEAAQRIISPPLPAIISFSEEQSPEMRDRIFAEFNTLSVIYRAPASSFVQSGPDLAEEQYPPPPESPGRSAGAVDEGSSLLDEAQRADYGADDLLATSNGNSPGMGAPAGAPAAAAAAPAVDLLGLDDLLGGPAPPAPLPTGPKLSLAPLPALAPAEFQGQWGMLPAAPRFTHPLTPAAVSVIEANKHQDFCRHLAASNIATMASGGQAPMYRFYFHAQEAGTGTRVLVEVIVNKTAGNASVTVKSSDVGLASSFSDLLRTCLNTVAV
eukprot:jgi/Botrbrau1/15513/Bobra.0225s0004.1